MCPPELEDLPNDPEMAPTEPQESQKLSPWHPLRWPRFLWFIIGYNLFVGALVTMVSIAGGVTEEGLFYFFALFFLFFGGNLCLLIAWGVAGLIAPHMGWSNQPVRRYAWLWAPVGLVSGVVLGLI